MKLNSEQRAAIVAQRDRARDAVDELLAELVKERATHPGRLAEALAWRVDQLMRADMLFAWWQQVLDAPEEATLEGVREVVARELRTWRPPTSGGGEGHRVRERERHGCLVEVLDQLEGRLGGVGLLGVGLLGMGLPPERVTP